MRAPSAVSVVGLGKLGSCLAACLAYKGFTVYGLDTSKKISNQLARGKAPFPEPRLQELLNKAHARLHITAHVRELMTHTELTFIVLPTPSTRQGNFSDRILREFLITAAPMLKEKKTQHNFVVISTVSPGTLEHSLAPLIEEHSGKKLNKGFSLCYAPEFIALGNVVHDMLNPDLVLIGESGAAAGDQLEALYKKLCDNTPRVVRMSPVSAEITKIALNAYVTMKISFANTLGALCARTPDADVDAISSALGADRRIAPSYLKAGTAYGGPCFPRDSKAFAVCAEERGVRAPLAAASDEVNVLQVKELVRLVEREIVKGKHKTISIFGLAYKPGTPVIEESAAVRLIEHLRAKHPRLTVHVYDPLTHALAQQKFGRALRYASSLERCLKGSSLWVITTPDARFTRISKKHCTHPTTIIDCWRLLKGKALGTKVRYLGGGMHVVA